MQVAAYPGIAGQENARPDIIRRFEARFAYLDSLIFSVGSPDPDTAGHGMALDNEVFPVPVSDSLTPLDSAYAERLRWQERAYKNKTGLQLSGQAYYRFDHAIGFDEDDAVSRYDGKIQAELRWYFLQSSVFKRKGYLEEIRLKGEIEQSSKKKESFGASVYRQREFFRFLHDSMISGVMLHRIENLDLLYEANRYLLANENISSDELLTIIDDKAEAERSLAALSGRFPFADDLSDVPAFAVRVDTAALIAHIGQSQNDMRLFDLRIRLLQQQERNTSYWSRFNLAPFVRYSYYIRPDLPNTSNIDAGISFTIPVSGESCVQKKVLRAEQDVLWAERDRLGMQISDRIRYMSEEIERLNRAIEGECLRIGELKKYIAGRTLAYGNRIGEYNIVARLKEYNAYLRCMEKLIEFQYRRNCRLMDLQELLVDGSILRYCVAGPFKGTANKQER